MKILLRSFVLFFLVAIVSFGVALSSLQVKADEELIENNVNIFENFDSFQTENNLELDSSFQANWYTHADTGTGSMTVVEDPVDPTNKVAKVCGSTYYTIVPRNIITRNCTISYRVNPITTIGTHWVATQFRKKEITSINGGNGVFWLYHTRFGSSDNKQVVTDTVPHNAPAENTFTQWDSEPIIVESGVKGTWFEVKNVIKDNYVYNYVNGYLLNVSYTSHMNYAGYIGIHSLCIDFYLDDIEIITEDEYAFKVESDNPNAGSVSINRSSGNENSEIELTANANLGYEFLGWYENDELLSLETNYTVTTPNNSDRTFIAKWLASKFNLSVSSYDENRGLTTGSGEFEAGIETLLSAIPENGFKFAGWYYNDVFLSDEEQYNYTTIAEDANIKAKFVPIDAVSYTITLFAKTNEETEIAGNGKLSTTGGTAEVIGKNEFFDGQLVTLKAEPLYEYTFKGWYNVDTSELISVEEQYIFELNSNLNIQAVFEDRLFVVKVQNGVNKEETNHYFKYGTNVILTYTIPEIGYSFSTWYCSLDDVEVFEGRLSFVVVEDIDVQAIYTKNKNNVTISTNAKELGGVSGGYALGAGEVVYGDAVTIKPVANEGYVFKSYTLDGIVGTLNEDGSISFSMPDNDVKIVLNFAKAQTINLWKDVAGFAICFGFICLAVLLIIRKKKKD